MPEKQHSTGPTYCDFCDRSGIVFNKHFGELGQNALVPCPKCVVPKCRCGGEEPYYYYENGLIKSCACRETMMKIGRILEIYANSGIDKHYRWKRVDAFKVYSELGKKAKLQAYETVKKFPDVSKGLFLWGNPGTGKTLLASIILTELIIHHAVQGRYIKISRTFFNRLKATFAEGSETYGMSSKIEKEFADVDVLVVDDFGVQRDTEWEQETLYNLVDARYEGEKFTVFTSNKNPHEEFKDLSGGRVLSRIKEMTVIMELSGKDQRESQ